MEGAITAHRDHGVRGAATTLEAREAARSSSCCCSRPPSTRSRPTGGSLLPRRQGSAHLHGSSSAGIENAAVDRKVRVRGRLVERIGRAVARCRLRRTWSGAPLGPDEVLTLVRSGTEILEIDEDRITRDSSFADDLDADSLALIELVEALEDELGERTVGFTIDDETSPTSTPSATPSTTWWVGSVGERSGVRRGANASARVGRPRTGPVMAALRPSLLPCADHRSFCRRIAVASNERLEFLGDSVLGLVVTTHVRRAIPRLARRRAGQAAGASSTRGARRGRGRARPRRGPAPGQGRGRVRRAREAVDPGRRDGGGDRRSTSTAAGMPAELRARAAERSHPGGAVGPGGQDYKTRLQELAARRFDQLPRYQVRAEGPDHRQAFFGDGAAGRRRLATGRSFQEARRAGSRASRAALRDRLRQRRWPNRERQPGCPSSRSRGDPPRSRTGGRRQEDQKRRGRRDARGAPSPQPQAVASRLRKDEDHLGSSVMASTSC